MKRMLDEVIEAAQARAAASENKSGGHLAVQAGALKVVANQREQFHGARFDDVREHVRKNLSRWAVADAGDFQRAIVFEERRRRPAVAALDALGFWNGGAQANGKIVGEMVAANRDNADVANHAAAVREHFGGAAADIEQAAAEFALVLSEAGFGGSERLEHGVADEDARLVRGGDEILRCRDGGSDDVNVGDEALANHSDGIANAVLRIHDEFVRQDVKDFSVFGKRNVACGVDSAANVFAFDVARTLAERDAAAAVHAADIMPGDTDERFFDRDVGNAFRFFYGAADGTHGGIEIDDEPLAQTFGFGGAQRQKLYSFAFELGDEDGSLRAAYV